MKVIATNYQADCSWIPKHTDDYFVYDRSGCGLDPLKVKNVPNIGNADYDKLTYIIDNYDNLPDVFLLTKSNLFKYITPWEFETVKNKQTFTPLLTMLHKTHMPVCYYSDDGMYSEINNSWYLNHVPAKHFRTYNDFARAFGLPTPVYLKFAPGGNYIVTKDRVRRYPKVFYERLRALLDYTVLPGEAHFIERTYYTLWS